MRWELEEEGMGETHGSPQGFFKALLYRTIKALVSWLRPSLCLDLGLKVATTSLLFKFVSSHLYYEVPGPRWGGAGEIHEHSSLQRSGLLLIFLSLTHLTLVPSAEYGLTRLKHYIGLAVD